MKYAALASVAIIIGGCVSITPRAQKIQLLPSTDTQLATCTKLGAVDAEASAMGQINAGDLDHQAENNLRDVAAAKWGDGVDTVALINVDHATTKATASGTGYKCASNDDRSRLLLNVGMVRHLAQAPDVDETIPDRSYWTVALSDPPARRVVTPVVSICIKKARISWA